MNTDQSKVYRRIVSDIALFLAVIYAPWWLVSILVFACAVYFRNFYEAFIAGFLFDAFYGTAITSLHNFRFVFSIAFLLLIAITEFIKEKIRV